MASALFQIDVGSGYQTAGESQDMPAAGGYVYCRIASMAGIDPTRIAWTNFGTHNSTQSVLTPTLQGNPTGQIARFTIPAGANQGFGFQLAVNGGVGANGGDTKTAAVYVLNAQGRRPFFIGESTEDDPTHYTVPRLNEMSNAAGARAGTFTLSSGTATITDSTVTADTVVIANCTTASSRGTLTYSVTPGTGITITSSNGADASAYAYALAG